MQTSSQQDIVKLVEAIVINRTAATHFINALSLALKQRNPRNRGEDVAILVEILLDCEAERRARVRRTEKADG